MECTEEDCARPVYFRDRCNRHYQQWLKAQPPRSSMLVCCHCKNEFQNPARQGPDRKFCSPACRVKYFNDQRSLKPRPPRLCKCGAPAMHRVGVAVCVNCKVESRTREYKSELYLAHKLKDYGLTVADYDRMLAAQRGRCAICRSQTPKGPGRWHIDHDHVTGQVRGLLCNNCNRGIGFLEDDPEVIKRAAAYVAKHRQMELFQKAG